MWADPHPNTKTLNIKLLDQNQCGILGWTFCGSDPPAGPPPLPCCSCNHVTQWDLQSPSHKHWKAVCCAFYSSKKRIYNMKWWLSMPHRVKSWFFFSTGYQINTKFSSISCGKSATIHFKTYWGKSESWIFHSSLKEIVINSNFSLQLSKQI